MSYFRLATGTFLLAAALTLVGCGQGTVTFGGKTDNGGTTFVTVTGNIDNVTPVTARDIVVFVFTNLSQASIDACTFDTYDDGEVVVVSNGSSTFTLGNINSGALTVVFLLDNAGQAADGQIDDGDPIAILSDPDSELTSVRAQLEVTLENVDIAFSPAGSAFCPPGTADASRITKAGVQ